jgi:subtilisin family serine protease
VIVADLDTGINYSHPDLQGKTVPGYDFINNDGDPTDDSGHGTGTAAIIAANSDNGIGITGLCWQCRLMPVKVLNSSASGTYSALANGITWATDHGARVINMSLGGTTASSSLQSAVQYAVDHGVVLVGASGNYGSTAPFYPAYYDGVISVAGTTSSDGLYSWSDYGSWVSLAAPGCDYTASLSGYTSSFCGTSASAPVVSGLAGLLAADTAATGAGITNAIESSSVPIGSQVAYGRVDAAAALSALASAPAPAPTTSPSPSPSPSPTPTAATSSATFPGSTTQKSLADSYSISTSTGSLTATVTFTRTSSMTVQLVANDGTVISQGSGASGLRLTASVQAGTYRVVVSAGGRSNYTLVVNFPQP